MYEFYLKYCEEFKVHLEYSLPIDWNKTFKDGYESWETETPYIDIVLEKKALTDGNSPEFVAIELKYKLKEASLPKDTSFLRFGEAPNSEANSSVQIINGSKHCHATKVQTLQVWYLIKCNSAQGNYLMINYTDS